MTTGSWSIGSPNYDTSTIYASKSWSGGNGKYEAWAGGTRSKWNSYTMVRRRWTSTIKQANYGVGSIVDVSTTAALSNAGWSANDDLRLLSKLWEAVRGHSLDLGVNIAEAGKTYGTIVQNCRSLGRSLVSLKHGQIGNAMRHLGSGPRHRPDKFKAVRRLDASDVSGRWLELQYAWMPLVKDSFEAAKALEAVTGPRVYKFRVASASKRYTYNGSTVPGAFKYMVNVSVKKSILAELYEDVGIARALGLTNPETILWEVVPYSFVVDWFIPIGTYLNVWRQIPSLKGRFLSTTKVGSKLGSLVVLNPVGNPGYRGTTKTDECFRIERTFSTSLQVPRPTFNSLPRALSPRRLLSSIALIHQRLK